MKKLTISNSNSLNLKLSDFNDPEFYKNNFSIEFVNRYLENINFGLWLDVKNYSENTFDNISLTENDNIKGKSFEYITTDVVTNVVKNTISSFELAFNNPDYSSLSIEQKIKFISIFRTKVQKNLNMNDISKKIILKNLKSYKKSITPKVTKVIVDKAISAASVAKTMVVSDIIDATYRVGTERAVDFAGMMLMKAAGNIDWLNVFGNETHNYFNSVVGRSLLASFMGWFMYNSEFCMNNEQLSRLSKELRVLGMQTAGQFVLDKVKDKLFDGFNKALNKIPQDTLLLSEGLESQLSNAKPVRYA